MRKDARVDVRDVPRGVPLGAKVGVVIMFVGLGLDAFVHLFVTHAENLAIAGVSLPEHFSHLVVIVGMLVMLGTIVTSGRRNSRRTSRRPHLTGGNDAVR